MGKQLCEIILNLDQWFSRICRLKIFLIWSSDCPLVQQSGTICAILGKENYEDQFCDSFPLGPAVQEGMPLKDISYLELWQHLRSFKWNHLCNFGRKHHEETFCEMVLNLNSGSGDGV